MVLQRRDHVVEVKERMLVSIVKLSTMVLQQFAGEFLADDGRVPIVKESTMVLQRRDRGSVEHARLEFQL